MVPMGGMGCPADFFFVLFFLFLPLSVCPSSPPPPSTPSLVMYVPRKKMSLFVCVDFFCSLGFCGMHCKQDWKELKPRNVGTVLHAAICRGRNRSPGFSPTCDTQVNRMGFFRPGSCAATISSRQTTQNALKT